MYYENARYFPAIFFTIFLLTVFYIWTSARRNARVGRFADKRLINEIAPTVSRFGRLAKTIIIVTALFFALLALARPQWGFEWEEVKRKGLDILIAIDVSKSMLARDVKPNRLERSKFAVKDLVKKLNGDRVGLIAFSGTAFLQCPLTIDYNGFLLALDDLVVGTIPRGGTSLSAAINEAIRVFGGAEKKYKVLIIITDGEDFEGNAIKAANIAASSGIMIYCIGVGSSEGDLVPMVDERGQRYFLADKSGDAVKTRLNEEILKKIAIATGGSYIRATQAEFGLTLLYDKSISRLEKKDIDSKMKKRYQDRFEYFLWPALILLILESFVSERRRQAS